MIREALLQALEIGGVNALAAHAAGRALVVLRYHGVTQQRHATLAGAPLHAEAFQAQLSALRGRYQVISLDRALDMLAGRAAWRARCVVLTFDDGYQNNATVAAPLLRDMGMTAAFFVTTDFMDGVRPLWFDRLAFALQVTTARRLAVRLADVEHTYVLTTQDQRAACLHDLKRRFKRLDISACEPVLAEIEHALSARLADRWHADECFAPMTWAQARTLQAMGMHIGAHTASHQILGVVSAERARQEVVEARRRIARELGASCSTFAYPNGQPGDFTPQTRAMLAECGVEAALTTVTGRVSPGADPLQLSRVAAGQPVSRAKFRAELSGVLPALLTIRAQALGGRRGAHATPADRRRAHAPAD